MPVVSKPTQSTNLLLLATRIGIVIFYVLFTLLPNSNSMMVRWPWVFLWQFGLMLGPVLLILQLWQRTFRPLGKWLDATAVAWCLLFVFSAAFAQFWHQALWYGWAAICGIAFLYTLNSWLTSVKRVQKLLVFQGVLSVVFSGSSLVAWYFQTVRPYLDNIKTLETYGVESSFDLKIETLRNWHPLGHQNYVAGYLMLVLPLLVGLAFAQKGWKRVAWLCGFALGLGTLYSTASRAGWFGLIASVATFIVLAAWHYPKLRKILLGVGLACFSAIALWGFSSDRIRGLITALLNKGGDGELSYRAVTNATGWFMGLDHPILGAGLGGVTLLYQKYRPHWAEREAELTYQLHSTPAQLWAELGISGVLLTLATLITVIYLAVRWCQYKTCSTAEKNKASTPLPLIIGIVSGLAGYSVYAITDYQLDNICISGTLIIFVAVLVFENRSQAEAEEEASSPLISTSAFRRMALAVSGIVMAVCIWLLPVHRAWMLSSNGFLALQQEDVASFVSYLEKAHKLAPWEPYYPYQLGWNLGELAFQSTDAEQQEVLRQEAVKWFEKAIALSPNREFGYSNLGWLLVNKDPKQATNAFFKATQLVPDKKGAYFSLGYSLLKQGDTNLAIQAFNIALLQYPVLLTSPIWQSEELKEIYPALLSELDSYLLEQAKAESSESSRHQIYQMQGMLHWWQGEHMLASQSWSYSSTEQNKVLLELTNTQPGDETTRKVKSSFPSNGVLSAWAKAQDGDILLTKTIFQKASSTAYIDADALVRLVEDIQKSISKSPSFKTWLTQNAPVRQNRYQRLGFGTISRHIDGSLPRDFLISPENVVVTDFLNHWFPSVSSQSEMKVLIENLEKSLEELV